MKKKDMNLVVMGDWNALIGETRDDKEVGEFGLYPSFTSTHES